MPVTFGKLTSLSSHACVPNLNATECLYLGDTHRRCAQIASLLAPDAEPRTGEVVHAMKLSEQSGISGDTTGTIVIRFALNEEWSGFKRPN